MDQKGNESEIPSGESISVVDSIPFAFFSIGNDYRIVRTNSKFRKMFPSFSDGDMCYSTILGPGTAPCENCLIKNASESGKEKSREITAGTGGGKRFFRLTASPLFDSSGKISGAMEYIEDLSSRLAAEEKISDYSRHLEILTAQRSSNLRKNEHETALMANSFHEINTAKDSSDLVLEIVNSFIKFRALPVFFAPFDPANTAMLSLSMHPANYSLEKIEGNDDGTVQITEDNPFIETARNRRFIIFHGQKEVIHFTRRTFPGKSELFYSAMMQVLSGCSILLLPLHTENGVEGVIGLAVSPSHLMEHFDTYRHIAEYSAMSLARQNSTLRMQQAQQMT
ncbi:MAG: PAS domain-containing protein, partial [Spirochaetota bacterium]